MAIASLGRESIDKALPPLVRWITAKQVVSLRSEISILLTLIWVLSMMFFKMSWVIGLDNLTPSISLAIAVASSRPIQIGKVCSPSIFFKIIIGLFATGSILNEDMVIAFSAKFPHLQYFKFMDFWNLGIDERLSHDIYASLCELPVCIAWLFWRTDR